MNQKIRYFRIHGDNIIECERTLKLISQALHVQFTPTNSLLFRPIHKTTIGDTTYLLELLSGHGRWGIDICDVLLSNGGILREGADSYITEVQGNTEIILLSLEYCSALPAGNNAWQRSGRAYSSILAGIPYMYFAELGGVELDANRKVKAPRFPNPVVPYSYIATTQRMKQFCIPIYTPHPSISEILYKQYQGIFGMKESLQIIRGIIIKEDYSKALDSLQKKGIEMVKLLSATRRSIDTFRGDEWTDFYNSPSSIEYINHSNLIWKASIGTKVLVSKTYRELRERIYDLKCKTIGSNNLPICVIPKEKISSLKSILDTIYPTINTNITSDKDLVIVWITGFKPKGDDSRPDRGLTPLAKMVIGNEANIMVVVYGPAKQATWTNLQNLRDRLAKENGLWQSILNIANYVLIDSATCNSKLFYKLNNNIHENQNIVTFKYHVSNPDFGEHDTDTAIHSMFARKEFLNIKEALCNPPGGDWSGISYFTTFGEEFRWTSLPRVSAHAKRPDHLIQIEEQNNDIFIIIESKQRARNLEDNIGDSLKNYIKELFKTQPTAFKTRKSNWRLYKNQQFTPRPFKMITVGAFIFNNVEELSTHLQRGKLDAVFAFEFDVNTCVHVLVSKGRTSIVNILKKIITYMTNIKIQIHGF